MAVKNEIIEKQIELLGKQRESLMFSLKETDFSNMQAFQRKAELDLQINKIDSRIDTLLEKFI